MEEKKSIVREFALTTGALKNRSTVFLMTILVVVIGLVSYVSLPKESFPEVNIPYVAIKTIYPGNPPIDIENLITRPLENELYTIKGIKIMQSSSLQGSSDIMIEFNTNVDIKTALQDVKDAVDKAKGELPSDLDTDPMVMDIDPSEFPILNINMAGEYSVNQLRAFAEELEERIEEVYEISKVELKGVNEREVKINVDQHKLEALNLSLNDIETAITNENRSISGGEITIAGSKRSVRTLGEFANVDEIANVVVKAEKGNIIYLRDVAEVVDGWEEPKSFARQDKQSVVSLQVVKKGGENILNASEQIFEILDNAKHDGTLPEDLRITVTNDQSQQIRAQITNLENSIILGVIFVSAVLYFFLGWRNALFVGLGIPMSMFLSFVVLGLMGITINMMVLFALVLALGMLVDNAIVVVENIYRFVSLGYKIKDAAKLAVGEIAWPIIASTATTLAAFAPLAFWPGLIGEFMKYLPITLIIVLSSSLFVALVIVPVFAAKFINPDKTDEPEARSSLILTGVLVTVAVIAYLFGGIALGNIMMVFAILIFLNWAFMYRLSVWFQDVVLTWLENFYLRTLNFALHGAKPYLFLVGTVLLLVFTQVLMKVRAPKIELFPANAPKFINVKAELPIGTDIYTTDSIMHLVEDDIAQYIDEKNYTKIVESMLTTVGQGAVGQNEIPRGDTPNKGITTITFVDYEYRKGTDTREIAKELSHRLQFKYPGVILNVEKNRNGPPTGKAVNIELRGPDFDKLLALTENVQNYLSDENIAGLEGLGIELDLGKPEMLVHIDRDKARRFGMSTLQIAGTLRNALYGKEVSKYKDGEDDIPIYVRFAEQYRNSTPALLNQKISFQNKEGKKMQIPISAVAEAEYSTTFGAVKRIDKERVITLSSNVLEGANATEVNQKIAFLLEQYDFPANYTWKLTGQQQEQQKSMAFLIKAMGIAVAVIMLILVGQFNSVVKPFLIVLTIVFSTIGVFGGLATFRMDFIVIMTGIGIISLAGIVVNNAIVLIDYIDYLKRLRKEELDMDEEANLPIDTILDIIVVGGKTRLRPVLLTAITTILGLVPMAIGLNLNFITLFTEFDPQIYFGGDNADFWAPMAWTVIFGLTFSTFLTLIIVPVMYYVANKVKLFFARA